MEQTHTLSVLVENKPGVLTRVSALFARRAFNITSLTVGETEHPEISRMTIIVKAEDQPFEQVTKQLAREPYPYPQLKILRKPESIFDYEFEDFELVNYQHHPGIKAPVAV